MQPTITGLNPNANPQAAGFDFALALKLARFSEMAYDRATIDDPFTNAGAMVTVDEHGDVVVAFRGSMSARDFQQDAEFGFEELVWSKNDAAAKVHHGFLEDFEAIDEQVVHAVKDILLDSPSAKVFITGHSLGGALAILCALEFSRQKIPVTNVITFGQPRVGNATFREIYNDSLLERTFHVIAANDPVPLLPPLLCGYRDEGNEIYLPRFGAARLNPFIGFQICGDILGALDSWRRLKLALLPNHYIASYIERIQQYL